MAKYIPLKDALKIWEEKHPGQKPEEQTVLKCLMYQPFINKMDTSIQGFSKLEQLSLSTNLIDKISNLNGLDSLKILSLGRNNIKKIEGLESIANTLEELWLSYNLIDKLNGIESCKKLKVLYMSNNKIKDFAGLMPAAGLPLLEDVLFSGNPVEDKATADGNWVSEITKRFPFTKKLDGKPIIREDVGDSEDKEKV